MSLQWIWVAILLGLGSSFHCVGMCGPLILANAKLSLGVKQYTIDKIIYFLGKSGAYGFIGYVLAGISQKMSVFIGQRIFSIASAIVLLFVWGFIYFSKSNSIITKWSFYWQKYMGKYFMNRKTNQFILGFLNGWLPCHSVLFASGIAFTTSNAFTGFLFMFFFGMATFPALYAFGRIGTSIPSITRNSFNRFSRIISFLAICILLYRGVHSMAEHKGDTQISTCISK